MAQYARPETVIQNPSPYWFAYGAATIPEAIDEVTPSDSDYVYTEGTTILIVECSDVTDPESSSGHVVRWRWRSTRDSVPPEKATIALYCGSTVIVLIYNGVTLPTTWTTDSYTLTAEEADLITNYGALRLYVHATALGTNEQLQVSWFEVEVPNAPSEGGASNLMLLGVG